MDSVLDVRMRCGAILTLEAHDSLGRGAVEHRANKLEQRIVDTVLTRSGPPFQMDRKYEILWSRQPGSNRRPADRETTMRADDVGAGVTTSLEHHSWRLQLVAVTAPSPASCMDDCEPQFVQTKQQICLDSMATPLPTLHLGWIHPAVCRCRSPNLARGSS